MKMWIYVAVALAFALLAATANHYHNKWVEAQTVIAVKEAELASALQSVRECSDNTRKLAEDTSTKIQEVAKAQAEAATAAKKNYSAANKILEAVATNPNQCIAALELIRQYKSGAFEDKK